MRVLICGSRVWTDKERIRRELIGLGVGYIDCIIEGGARGADLLSKEVALELRILVDEYPAHWKLYGSSAGFIRNGYMLKKGKPDLVLAFIIGNSPGTSNMIKQARKAEVEVRVFEG